MTENDQFCASCGKTQKSAGASGSDIAGKLKDIGTSGDDFTGEFDPADVSANKMLALFSYIGILFLVPLLGASGSKYARFHANQGIMLFICEIAISIVSGIFAFMAELFFVFGILSLVAWLLGVAAFVFMILGIMNAVNGKAKELPIIGKFRVLK